MSVDPPSTPPAQPQIIAQRPQQAKVVDSAVFKETAVLDRSYGIDQIGWQFVKADQAALGAVLPFGEPGDELWFQLISIQRLASIAGNLLDHTFVEGDRGALFGVVRLRPGLDRNARIVERVGSHPRSLAIVVSAVTSVAQLLGNRLRSQLLSDPYLLRGGIDLAVCSKSGFCSHSSTLCR